jgi:S-(hydroxymethyl)glutathione dehydrogenase/alcohol dehydrogenase
MRTTAAVVRQVDEDWAVIDLDLDDPKYGEVLVRWVASGLCHSDEHIRDGLMTGRLPVVGGHEGAGIVEAVGEGVERLKVGDHVVSSFIPICGRCRWCARGRTYLCDNAAVITQGAGLDGTFRWHAEGLDFGAIDMLGTFSEFAVVNQHSLVPIDQDIPLEEVALIGCGAPTGWGSAVNAGGVRPGDTTVVFGVGGLGHYAVQGAKMAGAEQIVAVDPVQFKRDSALTFGATHTASNGEETVALVKEITRGVGADQAIITMGVADTQTIKYAFESISKGATVVLTSASPETGDTIQLSGIETTFWNKRIQGSIYGQCNPFDDIPRLIRLWQNGLLRVPETITKRYDLTEINEGYRAMHDGENVRGLIVHRA